MAGILRGNAGCQTIPSGNAGVNEISPRERLFPLAIPTAAE